MIFRVNTPFPALKITCPPCPSAMDIDQLIAESKPLTAEADNGAKLVFDTDALKGISSRLPVISGWRSKTFLPPIRKTTPTSWCSL